VSEVRDALLRALQRTKGYWRSPGSVFFQAIRVLHGVMMNTLRHWCANPQAGILAVLLLSATASLAQPPQPPPNEVWGLALSPDGKILAAGAGRWDVPGEVGVWDLATRQPLRRFSESLGVASVAFSADGRLLAMGSWNGHVRVREWTSGRVVADIAVPGVARVAFAPKGNLLALATESKLVQLWDVARNQLVADLQGDLFRFHIVAFSPDGQRVAAGGGDWKRDGINQVTLWDVASKKQVMKLVGHQSAVLAIAYDPAGKTIATGSVDNTVRLWDAETGKNLKTLRGHRHYVEGLTFSADGKTLISGCRDGTVRFWDVERGEETAQLPFSPGVCPVRLSPDGTQLLVGGSRKTLKVFDIATQQELATLWNGVEPGQAPIDALPETVPPRPRGRGMLAAALLGLLAVLGMGLWFVAHRRRNGQARWSRAEVLAAIVAVSAASGGLLLFGLRLLADRVPPAVTPLQKAAAKVRELEADTIDADAWPDTTDQDLADLRDLPNLRHLRLQHTQITDAGVKRIGRLTHLVSLYVADTKISDAGLAELKDLQGLKELRLSKSAITDAGLVHLHPLSSLEALNLDKSNITDAGLRHLQPLTRLEQLNLDELPITDAGLEHLKGLTRLKKLSLWRTRITDDGLRHLRPLTALNHLSVDETNISDKGLHELYELKELRYLSVWRTRVTAGGAQELRKHLPATKVNQ
jgi:hypothetical protein